MDRRYERTEVKQITKQWVMENCKNITERDKGLLRLLSDNKRKLLRRDQIEQLYPEFASTDRLNKRIKTLFQMHVLDKIYPPVGIGEGSSKQHICLDRAGIILMELQKYIKPISIDTNGNRSLPLGWGHKVAINDYECLIRSLGAEIVTYEVEQFYNYNDCKIIPDITCLIRCNGKGYLFFIEVDLGTEDIPYIKSKIDSYTDFYRSRAWINTPWAKLFKIPTFPRILLFTQNGREKRKATLQDYTKESALRWRFGFHSEAVSILQDIMKG